MSKILSPVREKAPAISSWNADYAEEMYRAWQQDPEQLSESWQMFFRGFEMAMCPRSCVASSRAHAQSQVASLIFAYRSQGHLAAHLNPLADEPDAVPDLELDKFGLSAEQLDTVFDTGHLGGPPRAALSEIVSILKDTYCRSIGVQYTHIQNPAIRRWLQQAMEPIRNRPDYDADKKKEILRCLNDAEMFETFIQTKFPGQKRFSLEGAETLIPAFHALVELAPEVGVKEIVVGMAHRGRLNVLVNILDKSYDMIFSEFEGNMPVDSYGGDGDVKYHLGFSSDHVNRWGRTVHLSLNANPSHLEAVNPVVEGKARAKQRQHHVSSGGSYRPGETVDRRVVLPFIIHGDAAFAGQGLVAETLNLSQLPGYRTGGTVHFIVNNQIGFTTNPADSRSSAYCSDVAKMIEAPIFHVNGDDPQAVVFCTELALRFRQEFQSDVVVDMLCYRRHGHNEGDEPAFTQPLMYERIRNHSSVRKLYTQQLLEENVVTQEEVKKIVSDFKSRLQARFDEHKQMKRVDYRSHSFDVRWTGLNLPFTHDAVATGVAKEILQKVAIAATSVPGGFNLSPKIARQLQERSTVVEDGGSVDWAFAETLALGSLLAEGTPVRLSGQDSARGTFSQRHAQWWDMKTNAPYIPLNHISPQQAHFCIYNSPLSEASVLGFDYGYSLAEPRMLIIWEAQFGDFANGAQVVIDQFITSSQSKWQRTSGIVMLLPHGYEGQGPEHSNAYLERYLSACAQDNIQVMNLTTPAQYFHALRRQMLRPFRRPLVLMAPKSMLRHKLCLSPISDLMQGRFHEILDDPMQPKAARRLILCTGKLFYELIEQREAEGVEDVAVVRIEQLYPLNHQAMKAVIERYSKVKEIVWAQEEPKNRGAWSFIRPWLQYMFPQHQLRYIGRGFAASPASGSFKRFLNEQENIVNTAIHGGVAAHDVTILPEGVNAL